MLRADVREAVKENRFAIYSVQNIDQMMELLTGRKAGIKDKMNRYPEDTINYLVQKRIEKLNSLRKTFAADNKGSAQHKFSRNNERKN
jgi:hypothetical protein